MSQDWSTRDPEELPWMVKLTRISGTVMQVSLMSPCCSSHMALHVTPEVGRQAPRLYPYIPYERLSCMDCNSLFPPTPLVWRIEARWPCGEDNRELTLETFATWAEQFAGHGPLSAQLWADELVAYATHLLQTEAPSPVSFLLTVDDRPHAANSAPEA